jgi:hypothetical protein
MKYEKTLIDNDGEEFPYSESFDDESYFYYISVIWNDRDCELNVLKDGTNLIFFDDGSWLDSNIVPEKIFPDKNKLTESDLLKLINILETEDIKTKLYTKKEMDLYYQKFLNLTK